MIKLKDILLEQYQWLDDLYKLLIGKTRPKPSSVTGKTKLPTLKVITTSTITTKNIKLLHNNNLSWFLTNGESIMKKYDFDEKVFTYIAENIKKIETGGPIAKKSFENIKGYLGLHELTPLRDNLELLVKYKNKILLKLRSLNRLSKSNPVIKDAMDKLIKGEICRVINIFT